MDRGATEMLGEYGDTESRNMGGVVGAGMGEENRVGLDWRRTKKVMDLMTGRSF